MSERYGGPVCGLVCRTCRVLIDCGISKRPNPAALDAHATHDFTDWPECCPWTYFENGNLYAYVDGGDESYVMAEGAQAFTRQCGDYDCDCELPHPFAAVGCE